jgi:acyl-CoA synthetase (AMP-forming)/AMP-acid ligase II
VRIADLVRRHAFARPDETAIRCPEGSICWSDLERRTSALASVLAANLAPGARVAILTKSCHRHWETLFAASRAGLVGVPINYRWLASEVEQVLKDCAASALVVQVGLLGVDDLARLAAVASIGLVLSFDGSHPHAVDYESALASAGPTDEHPRSEINVIGYTSGTTGRPKGAALTADAAILSAFWFASLFGLQAGDRFLACMPIYVFRGGAGGLSPFIAGACSILQDFDAAAVVDLIERERVTHVILAPVMVDRLLQMPDIGSRDLTSLRGVWLGGAPSSPSAITALQELVGDIVGTTYGGTEATGIASARWSADPAKAHLLRSAGRPAPVMDVRLVTDDGRDVAVDEPGEIVVRGNTVMAGYWPDVPGGGLQDGWYHTGDIATRDSDGNLFLVDRSVDIVNSGGLNVYPTEIEHVLLEHPDVAECAVVAAPDPALGETVAAFVVTAGHGKLSVEQVEEHCRPRLAGYKRPRLIVLVDALPRNAMGKVDRRELRQRLWEGRDTTISGPEHSDPTR